MQPGTLDLRGKIIGTLEVGTIFRRNPSLAWNTFCRKCKTRTVMDHARLVNGGGCRNNNCGKAALTPTAAKASINPIATAVRSSDSKSLKDFRRAEAREQSDRERAERDEQNSKKIKDAEEELQRTARQLSKIQRDAVRHRADSEFALPESAKNLRMSAQDAIEFNRIEAEKFVDATPDYYACSSNLTTISDYLLKNGCQIATAEVYGMAFRRLRDLGLLIEKPEPQPEITVPANVQPRQEPQGHEGVDPVTGLPRIYSTREVDHMTSDEYRRAFRLYSDRTPRFIDNRL